MTARNTYGQRWRYVRNGQRVHAVGPEWAEMLSSPVALCGADPGLFGDWLGTGSQDEYERVEALPQCAVCLRKLTRKRA